MSNRPTEARQWVRDALSHKQPVRVPMDFGSTAVTGMHVSVVAALREYYGLEARPVKVCEPYQMLGLIEDDLAEAMGIAVKGIFGPKTIFGFSLGHWKPWRMPDGLEVQVPGDFNTTVDRNGDILIFPQGDTSVPPSGRMPKGGYFFDAIIRQPPLDEEQLNWEDNGEEFQPISDQDLGTIRGTVSEAQKTGRAIMLSLPNMYLGDIALVPAPFLLERKYATPLVEAEYRVEAICADTTVATVLRVGVGSPIFLIERTSYSNGHRPVDYEKLHYRGEQIRFVTRLARRRPVPQRGSVRE
jgi:hypothetical protein